MLKTLRGKFTLVYIGLVVLAALVGGAGLYNLYRLEQSINNLMTANYKSIDAVSHMMEAIERQDSGLLIYISVDKARGIDLFTANGSEFQNRFNFEIGNITENGERDVVEKLKSDYAQYSKALYSLQEKTALGSAAAKEYYTGTASPLFEQIKTECRQLISINEDAMFASKQKTTDSARESMVVLLLLSLLAMTVGYIVARHFILLFLSPINRLSESISRVREGDLYQQLNISSNDEAGHLVSEFNDMTQRLQGYEQSSMGTLMSERNKSVAIVHSISDPLLVLDASWRILMINAACGSFFDIEEENVTGRHFLEAIHDGGLFENIEALAGSAGQRREKIISITKDSEYFFNLIVTPVIDPGSRSLGTIVAFQDVTGLKELERVKTDFMATISHEFKTPLTSIMMAASMLSEGAMGGLSEEQAETVDAIREDGDRLLALVNELLELIKIESGNEVYHIAPCSVYDMAEATVRSFAEHARIKEVTLTNDLASGLPIVNADFEKICWVLNNLISNALKYTTSGDSICVGAEQSDGFVLVSVQDTGIGIPQDYLDKIFEKFVQVKGRDIEVRGTGLGLSVSKDIVQAHGGNIWVSSQVDAGSTFTFTLPIADSEGEQ
jgi:PAS domain S-box-containing protein